MASSFKTVAPGNHVGTYTLQLLGYKNVITTLPNNYLVVQCLHADKFDTITEHGHRREVNRKRTMKSSRRHTHRPRARNRGNHPVTFPSVTQAYIDPRAYATAGEQRNPLSTIGIRFRNKFKIQDNNGHGNATIFPADCTHATRLRQST